MFFKDIASKFVTVNVTVYQNLTVIYLTFNYRLLKLFVNYFLFLQTNHLRHMSGS